MIQIGPWPGDDPVIIAFKELKETRGFPCAVSSVYDSLNDLTRRGFLTKKRMSDGSNQFKVVEGMKINIVEA